MGGDSKTSYGSGANGDISSPIVSGVDLGAFGRETEPLYQSLAQSGRLLDPNEIEIANSLSGQF